MHPAFANRSSLIPPESRLALHSQAPATHRPALPQVEQLSSFQNSDSIAVGDKMLQTPPWLQSNGQVDYANMLQHMLQVKRSMQVGLEYFDETL